MIIYPPLDKLMEKVDSRYSLVIATAKRARQLTKEGAGHMDKPVITAVNEIYSGAVSFENSAPAVELGDITAMPAAEPTDELVAETVDKPMDKPMDEPMDEPLKEE